MTDLDQLSSRDLERLSAYLDGELSSRETERIQARLMSEPELERALQALQATVTLFKELPHVRAPHNFTVTEAVKPRGYPILQFGTALAALAFILVVGADALVRGSVEEREAALFSREPEVLAPLALPQAESEQALDLDNVEADAEVPAAELEQQGELGRAEPAAPSEQAAAADEFAFADKLEEPDDSVQRELVPPEASDPTFFDGAAAGEQEEPAIQQPVLQEQEKDLLLPALRYGEVILGVAVLVLAALTLWVRRR